MRLFWESEGINIFNPLTVSSRAGDVGGKKERYWYSSYREKAQEIVQQQGFNHSCWATVFLPFIGWDGYYYLCCSDWSKIHKIGHVSTMAWSEVLAKRIELVNSENATLCGQCEYNIQNRIVDCFEYSATDQDVSNREEMLADIIDDRKKEEQLVEDFLAVYDSSLTQQ